MDMWLSLKRLKALAESRHVAVKKEEEAESVPRNS